MVESRDLCIVFHSGDFERVCHGLTIANVSAALGNDSHLLFTYQAIKRLVRDETDRTENDFIVKALAGGHMKKLTELIAMGRQFGSVHIYACSGSMALMNISRDELIEEVEKSMGLSTFMALWEDANVLFI